jgi:DNA-binding MarR family transcriptional regulator
MSNGRVFNQEEKTKLTQIVNEGISVLNEIETLNGGLNDTIKAIAEELDIKPSILKKAVKTAYKSTLTQTNEDHDELNTILETVGRTQ